MKRKPVSVLIVAILGLAYAGIDVLGNAANVLMFVFKVNFGRPDPGLEFIYSDALTGIFTVVTALATVVFTVWLVAGCIGSLRLRPWARTTMVRFGWVNLVMSIVVETVHLTAIMPRLLAAYPPGPEHTIAVVEQVVQGAMMLVPVGLSIAMVVVFRRQAVRDAFEGKGPADPRPFPVELGAPGA